MCCSVEPAGGWKWLVRATCGDKSEVRDPKSEPSSKSEVRAEAFGAKPPSGGAALSHSGLRISALGFLSDFGFRPSDFPPETALKFSFANSCPGWICNTRSNVIRAESRSPCLKKQTPRP